MLDVLGLKSQQQYSDLESGKKHFTPELLKNICKFFNISFLSFSTFSVTENRLNYESGTDDHRLIEKSENIEMSLLVYKKLFLESKLENIEYKLKQLHGNSHTPHLNVKSKIYVMI